MFKKLIFASSIVVMGMVSMPLLSMAMFTAPQGSTPLQPVPEYVAPNLSGGITHTSPTPDPEVIAPSSGGIDPHEQNSLEAGIAPLQKLEETPLWRRGLQITAGIVCIVLLVLYISIWKDRKKRLADHDNPKR
jgi:hypothetical protein